MRLAHSCTVCRHGRRIFTFICVSFAGTYSSACLFNGEVSRSAKDSTDEALPFDVTDSFEFVLTNLRNGIGIDVDTAPDIAGDGEAAGDMYELSGDPDGLAKGVCTGVLPVHIGMGRFGIDDAMGI